MGSHHLGGLGILAEGAVGGAGAGEVEVVEAFFLIKALTHYLILIAIFIVFLLLIGLFCLFDFEVLKFIRLFIHEFCYKEIFLEFFDDADAAFDFLLKILIFTYALHD